MATSEENTALRNAVNLICGYVKNNMPADWDLVLTMNSEEASFAFIDPDGDHRDEHVTDGDQSEIIDACEYAQSYADNADSDDPRAMGWVGDDGRP